MCGQPGVGQCVVSQERANVWSARSGPMCGQLREGQCVVSQEWASMESAKRGPMCRQPGMDQYVSAKGLPPKYLANADKVMPYQEKPLETVLLCFRCSTSAIQMRCYVNL